MNGNEIFLQLRPPFSNYDSQKCKNHTTITAATIFAIARGKFKSLFFHERSCAAARVRHGPARGAGARVGRGVLHPRAKGGAEATGVVPAAVTADDDCTSAANRGAGRGQGVGKVSFGGSIGLVSTLQRFNSFMVCKNRFLKLSRINNILFFVFMECTASPKREDSRKAVARAARENRRPVQVPMGRKRRESSLNRVSVWGAKTRCDLSMGGTGCCG